MTMPTSHTTRTTRRLLGATTALLLGLALSGCGALAENVAERAVEEAAEAANGGGEVDLDLDGEDGTISITSSEGSFSVGTSAEVPEDFPADVPLPEGAQVVSAMSFSDQSSSGHTLSMSVEGSADEVAEALTAAFEAGGFTIANTSQMDIEGLTTRTFEFERGDGTSGFVNVGETGDETVATYNVETPGTGEGA